jgi:hypothetical protein
MPVSFLTEEQTRRYGQFDGELSPEELARHFHLDDTDQGLIARRRWDHMRLGFGIQLGTVRFLGTFLDDPTRVPYGVIKNVARQIGVADLRCLEKYRQGNAHWEHAAEIRERLGYRPFTEPPVQFRLNRWLYALCWTGSDRPGVLFDRAVAWLLANKVLLPGLSVLERTVSRVRGRANEQLWRRLTKQVTPEQRERLEQLVIIPENERKSPLDRLRDGPVLQSPAELGRAIGRLEEVQALAAGLPSLIDCRQSA